MVKWSDLLWNNSFQGRPICGKGVSFSNIYWKHHRFQCTGSRGQERLYLELKTTIHVIKTSVRLEYQIYSVGQQIVLDRILFNLYTGTQDFYAWLLEKHINECPLFCVTCENFQKYQGPLLLTWFNFNPSMDK